MKKKILFLSFMGVALLQHIAHAQIDLVYDLDPTGNSVPATLTEFQGKLYFSAATAAEGRELYSYDGVHPPVLVTDFNPGSDDGINPIGNYAVIGSTMYLTADNGTTGMELYKFDGTNITLVADIATGSGSSEPFDFTVHDGILYFSASTSTFGRELYKYTPATNSLVRISDIISGSDDSVFPQYFTAKDGYGIIDNKLLFKSATPSGDNTISVYDIATNSITLLGLFPINPTDLYFFPGKSFTMYNGEIYFTAVETISGITNGYLYKYDGEDVVRLTEYESSTEWEVVIQIIGVYNNKIYVAGASSEAGDDIELYAYDPATESLELVYNINSSDHSKPCNGIVYNGLLYFTADDGTHGTELWSTDGTTTELVMDINPDLSYSPVMFLTVFKGKLYMTAGNAENGYELFVLETDDPAGIRNINFDGTVTLYPNPTDDVVNLSIDAPKAEPVQFNLYDMTGRQLLSEEIQLKGGKQTFQFDIEHLSNGSYFYQINNSDGVAYKSGKLIKQ